MTDAEKALRDEFAQAAITGILAAPKAAQDISAAGTTFGVLAYEKADAMLATRAKEKK